MGVSLELAASRTCLAISSLMRPDGYIALEDPRGIQGAHFERGCYRVESGSRALRGAEELDMSLLSDLKPGKKPIPKR
ncbi:hypothetical protein NMY22_g5408 [Coprinellus aureogranulatus]|nr:hypothetical protein NMY22_g5408 [Coprinellus aureogranulatus]